MHEAVAAIAAIGVSPIVRIAANEGWMVKRMLPASGYCSWQGRHRTDKQTDRQLTGVGALDTGAHGVLVPLIYSADDARQLVESAKFPPVGRRGFGSPFAMGNTGNVSAVEYLQTANDSLVTVVQIETKEALDNVCLSVRMLLGDINAEPNTGRGNRPGPRH